MKVLELMKTHIIKTEPDATIPDIVDLMDLYQLTSIPVVDPEGRLLGVVTERTVVQALLPEWLRPDAPGKASDAMEDARRRRVGDIMSVPGIGIDENADVREAVEIMLSCELKRLPVVSEGHVVGVINRIDVCQALLERQLENP